MVDLSSSLCKRLPGRVNEVSAHFEMDFPMNIHHHSFARLPPRGSFLDLPQRGSAASAGCGRHGTSGEEGRDPPHRKAPVEDCEGRDGAGIWWFWYVIPRFLDHVFFGEIWPEHAHPLSGAQRRYPWPYSTRTCKSCCKLCQVPENVHL